MQPFFVSLRRDGGSPRIVGGTTEAEARARAVEVSRHFLVYRVMASTSNEAIEHATQAMLAERRRARIPVETIRGVS